MRKLAVGVSFVSLVCAIVLAFVAFPQQDSEDKEDPLPVVPVAPPVPGTPRMNTTHVWIVIMGDIDREYPLDYYEAALLHNGDILVGPETLHPMLLGENGSLTFWFHEGRPGGGCGHPPYPCDGMLSKGDYLKLDMVTPGETYVVQVLWKATGEVLAEIEVNT